LFSFLRRHKNRSALAAAHGATALADLGRWGAARALALAHAGSAESEVWGADRAGIVLKVMNFLTP